MNLPWQLRRQGDREITLDLSTRTAIIVMMSRAIVQKSNFEDGLCMLRDDTETWNGYEDKAAVAGAGRGKRIRDTWKACRITGKVGQYGCTRRLLKGANEDGMTLWENKNVHH